MNMTAMDIISVQTVAAVQLCLAAESCSYIHGHNSMTIDTQCHTNLTQLNTLKFTLLIIIAIVYFL